MHKKKLIII